MIALLTFYWLPLLIAFAIGLATAWWCWGRGMSHFELYTDPDWTYEELPPPAEPLEGDDLTQIQWIGTQLDTRLRALGITTFAQIASWSEREADEIDAQLGPFKGCIRRDHWIAQARLLMAGELTGPRPRDAEREEPIFLKETPASDED